MNPYGIENGTDMAAANRGAAAIDAGVLILDATLQVLAANPAATCVIERADALTLSSGRLRAIRTGDDARLQEVCHHAKADDPGEWHGLVLPRRTGLRDYLLSIVAMDLCGNGNGLHVVIVDPENGIGLAAPHLQRFFGLTPTQSELTHRLGSGCRLEDAAATLGIKISTARSHLAEIFRKTRTDRIQSLTGLLAMMWSATQLQSAITGARHLPDLKEAKRFTEHARHSTDSNPIVTRNNDMNALA